MSKKLVYIVLGIATMMFSCSESSVSENQGSFMSLPSAIEVDSEPATISVLDESLPGIKFDTTTVNFGTINEGDVFETDFKFTNTGDADLVITSARGSCGCTVPEWPREAIAPGKTSQIHVKFNSRGKKNNQTKTVTLQTNASPTPITLYLKGFVTPTTK